MTDLRVVTSDGGGAILEEAAVQDFAAGLRGPLLRLGDGGYEEARTVWNGMINRRPAWWRRRAARELRIADRQHQDVRGDKGALWSRCCD